MGGENEGERAGREGNKEKEMESRSREGRRNKRGEGGEEGRRNTRGEGGEEGRRRGRGDVDGGEVVSRDNRSIKCTAMNNGLESERKAAMIGREGREKRV